MIYFQVGLSLDTQQPSDAILLPFRVFILHFQWSGDIRAQVELW